MEIKVVYMCPTLDKTKFLVVSFENNITKKMKFEVFKTNPNEIDLIRVYDLLKEGMYKEAYKKVSYNYNPVFTKHLNFEDVNYLLNKLKFLFNVSDTLMITKNIIKQTNYYRKLNIFHPAYKKHIMCIFFSRFYKKIQIPHICIGFLYKSKKYLKQGYYLIPLQSNFFNVVLETMQAFINSYYASLDDESFNIIKKINEVLLRFNDISKAVTDMEVGYNSFKNEFEKLKEKFASLDLVKKIDEMVDVVYKKVNYELTSALKRIEEKIKNLSKSAPRPAPSNNVSNNIDSNNKTEKIEENENSPTQLIANEISTFIDNSKPDLPPQSFYEEIKEEVKKENTYNQQENDNNNNNISNDNNDNNNKENENIYFKYFKLLLFYLTFFPFHADITKFPSIPYIKNASLANDNTLSNITDHELKDYILLTALIRYLRYFIFIHNPYFYTNNEIIHYYRYITEYYYPVLEAKLIKKYLNKTQINESVISEFRKYVVKKIGLENIKSILTSSNIKLTFDKTLDFYKKDMMKNENFYYEIQKLFDKTIDNPALIEGIYEIIRNVDYNEVTTKCTLIRSDIDAYKQTLLSYAFQSDLNEKIILSIIDLNSDASQLNKEYIVDEIEKIKTLQNSSEKISRILKLAVNYNLLNEFENLLNSLVLVDSTKDNKQKQSSNDFIKEMKNYVENNINDTYSKELLINFLNNPYLKKLSPETMLFAMMYYGLDNLTIDKFIDYINNRSKYKFSIYPKFLTQILSNQIDDIREILKPDSIFSTEQSKKETLSNFMHKYNDVMLQTNSNFLSFVQDIIDNVNAFVY